jgi:hypothetical protein
MKRTATALAGTLATLAFVAAPAHALTANTESADKITETSATVHGKVDPGLLTVAPSFYFEYGPTAAYGNTSPATPFSVPTTIKLTLLGLPSATTMHYRIVATGLLSTARGADKTFTTLDRSKSSDGTSGGDGSTGSTSGSGSGSGSSDSASTPTDAGSGSSGSDSSSGSSGSGDNQGGSGAQGDGSDNSDPTSGTETGAGPGSEQLAVTVEAQDPVKPVLGSTIGAAPETGSIQVRRPGTDDFSELQDGAPIPVGSTIDARNGSVNVVTAVGSAGKVQTATFKGAVFQVKQSRKTGGLTDIYLRGGDFASCKAAPASAHLLAKKKRRHAVRKLWGHDHHGRFRTHGRGAVATVRGTTWVVADHCEGTRTSVLSGAVSVRDLHRHKTVLVHAGHSYFARTHR